MMNKTKSRKITTSPLDRVRAVAKNLWWSWNPSAQRLFAALDPKLWDATHHNPIKTLHMLAIYPRLDFNAVPITDTGKMISLPIAGRTVHAKVWTQVVGRTHLYLLDTDVPQNKPVDRELTRHLYGGDRQYRIWQEMLLCV